MLTSLQVFDVNVLTPIARRDGRSGYGVPAALVVRLEVGGAEHSGAPHDAEGKVHFTMYDLLVVIKTYKPSMGHL